ALRNYLALLGWSPAGGETEILSTDELLAQFSLEHITKSPAVFDIRKLKWMNRQYMKQLPPAELAKRAVPFLAQPGFIAEPALPAVVGWLERVLDAVLKNLDALAQLPTATQSIFRFDAAKVLGTAAPVGFSLDDADRQVLAGRATGDGQNWPSAVPSHPGRPNGRNFGTRARKAHPDF
ncbi:MAG: hypothetical protein M1423_06420, partial [Acidobacteria bacterium]|nr:hypothetical protein [Acidobacteriota bacterium]